MRPYIQRDISWLDFNYRVLQEVRDKSVPLYDRIKFLAIYSSNLDEFFKVRVAGHRQFLRMGKKTVKDLGFDPVEILLQIQEIVNQHQLELNEIFFNEIVPELRQNGINIIRRQEMNAEQEAYIQNFFEQHLLPFVQPVLLVRSKIKPFLNNASLYLTLNLKDKETLKTEIALVKVPSDHIDRFIELPASRENQHDIIMLGDVVRHTISWLFPGYHILQSYSIKLTRDAELYIEDEFSGNLLEKIKKSLSKRHIGPAARLVYDRSMPKEILNELKDIFELTKYDLFPEGRYHNNFDFFKFPKFGKSHLSEPEWPQIPISLLEHTDKIFDHIAARDHLIHPPYHSYESVINFFEVAAQDPTVTHIKVVQYRVAEDSRIMEALISAAEKGKQVTVFVEIKARFDEAANIIWGERLAKAGVRVFWSMPGIKVHAKIATVIRVEGGQQGIYAYLSTGNFHEKTAFAYSDYGIFTKDKRLTVESIKLFNYLETCDSNGINFEYLGVGQFNLKEKLSELIQNEIEFAKKGQKASIIIKLNSFQDPEFVDLIYDANKAGVKIKLIIRGICSIAGGIKGISENISGISIVDRYLEHARAFIFNNGGDPKYFISSADWMYRNLNKRIEILTPIYCPNIQKHLKALLDLQLNDNVKARSLNADSYNKYIENKNNVRLRSQLETYLYIKRNER